MILRHFLVIISNYLRTKPLRNRSESYIIRPLTTYRIIIIIIQIGGGPAVLSAKGLYRLKTVTPRPQGFQTCQKKEVENSHCCTLYIVRELR